MNQTLQMIYSLPLTLLGDHFPNLLHHKIAEKSRDSTSKSPGVELWETAEAIPQPTSTSETKQARTLPGANNPVD